MFCAEYARRLKRSWGPVGGTALERSPTRQAVLNGQAQCGFLALQLQRFARPSVVLLQDRDRLGLAHLPSLFRWRTPNLRFDGKVLLDAKYDQVCWRYSPLIERTDFPSLG